MLRANGSGVEDLKLNQPIWQLIAIIIGPRKVVRQHRADIAHSCGHAVRNPAFADMGDHIDHGIPPHLIWNLRVDRFIRQNLGTMFGEREVDEDAGAPCGAAFGTDLKVPHRPIAHAL